MRYILTLSILLLFQIAKTNAQTTWVVCNMPGFPATFTDLQGAINDSRVAPGDILLVQGSTVNYGDIEVRKKVIIMGPGYFLSENTEMQSNLLSAKVNSIIFLEGSSGSILQGMDINGFLNRTEAINSKWYCYFGQIAHGSYSVEIRVPNVTVMSNNISNALLVLKVIGCVIRQNYVNTIYTSPEATAITMYNNIIYGAIDSYNANILQNSFVGGVFFCTNCTIQNNIISSTYNTTFDAGCQGWSFLPESSVVNYNLLPGGWSTNGTTNIAVGDWGFVSSGTTDGRYNFKSNSPVVSSGNGGVDIGHLAGLTPYKLSGISLHPNIFSVTMPNTATSGSGLKVEVKVRAND